MLDPYIGELTLETIHHGSLQPFIGARQQEGVKNHTINAALYKLSDKCLIWRPVSGWIKMV
ncbi:hypothetical protein [Coxiella-like endosymbiont of Rhipicephalus sanguineus]|uniref:hypothetical protein n=1 Tax=Coxiella-like endosymbiont of Rhipicephalus sanguineus TaxID=1955402 RepID=UPI002040C531|nr:hypothetical protein [Coxiella-like endosymbiont of Rhipicephalus sanguineus]